MDRYLTGLSIFVLSLLVAATPSSAAPSVVEKAPPPAWIIDFPVDLAASQPTEGVRDGLWVPLVDEQIHAPDQTSYQHFARKYLTQKAVQEASRISISFNPAFQTLAWNKLVVHRDGSVLDRLPTQEIRLISREENLENNLYNGSVSAIVELQDIRPGDIVEYAFSVRGENPIFHGKFSEFVSTVWSVPVHQFRFRLLWPENRKVLFRAVRTKLDATEQKEGSLIDYRWSANDIPAADPDGDAPSWESPYGWLQVAEYPSWGDVVDWALPYYQITDPLPPALGPVMERIRQIDSAEGRILAALEYVQNSIRYLSISEGVHSHKPYPITEVVDRGFGDCKDKARLLCAMLGSLGYDARPALIETTYRQSIADWLPTPEAFDHVVVRLKWAGQTYWLDPTVNDQRGSLAQRFFPDYRRALVIQPGERSLATVTPAGFDVDTTHLEERYVVTDYRKDVQFDSRTTYRGAQADAMRGSLASNTIEDLAKYCINFYERRHPGVQSDSLPLVRDDLVKNEIVIEEKYHIPNFWQARTETDKYLYTDLYAHLLDSDLASPAKPRRTSSLAIDHPRNARHTITVEMPDDSKFKAESRSIRNPAFTYDYSVSQKGRTLSIDHHYRSTLGIVPTFDLGTFLSDLRKARDELGYSISIPKSVLSESRDSTGTSSTSPLKSVNWVLLIFGFFILQLSLAIAAALYFWRPNWNRKSRDTRYVGLGGWLILVAIGLFLRVFYQVKSLFDVLPLLSRAVWDQVTVPGMPGYHPLWKTTILFETAALIAIVVFSIVLLVLFFQRRRTFPVLMIVMLAAYPVISFFDTVLVQQVSVLDDSESAQNYGQAFGAFFAAGIWIPYMFVSKRVRATFTK